MAVSLASNTTYAVMNWSSKMIFDSNAYNSYLHRTDVCGSHLADKQRPNQEWTLISTGTSDEFYIKGVWDGLCVDMTGGNSTGSGMWGNPCDASKDSQKWVFTQLPLGRDPRYCIVNKETGLAAGSTSSNSTTDSRCGFAVQGFQKNCIGDQLQQWMLWPLDPKIWTS